jgi:hypothetical protein
MSNLEQLLTSELPVVTLQTALIDLVITAVLSLILAWFYTRYGLSLSPRAQLARNFTPIALTTSLVITIVKSSLALSLGLVGALSIVRFRTAIKEPEELSYLFLSLAIGLGMGAGQRVMTVSALVVILGIMYLVNRLQPVGKEPAALYLTVVLAKPSKKSLPKLLAVIEEMADFFDAKRVEQSAGVLEIGGYLKLTGANQLTEFLAELKQQFPKAQVSVTDLAGE